MSRQQAAAEVAQSRPSALDSIQASSSKLPETSPASASASEAQSSYSAQLSAIPEFESYGPIFKSSSKPIELTESETEYVVTTVKHVFKEHVVFQFNVSNTIPDTVLEQVQVLMTPGPDTGLTEDFILPIPSLNAANGSGQVYVSFTRDDPASYAAGSFSCTLQFVSKEVDPSSGEPEEEGYQDEYQVEDCDLGSADVSDLPRPWIRLTRSTSRQRMSPLPASGTSWQARAPSRRLLRSPRQSHCAVSRALESSEPS